MEMFAQANIYEEVIEYFNKVTGKRFNWKSKATQQLINGRLADGYTLEDFKTVIDNQTARWKGDSWGDQYLRPSTLFRPTNFENYLNAPPVKDKSRLQRQPTYNLAAIERATMNNTEI